MVKLQVIHSWRLYCCSSNRHGDIFIHICPLLKQGIKIIAEKISFGWPCNHHSRFITHVSTSNVELHWHPFKLPNLVSLISNINPTNWQKSTRKWSYCRWGYTKIVNCIRVSVGKKWGSFSAEFEIEFGLDYVKLRFLSHFPCNLHFWVLLQIFYHVGMAWGLRWSMLCKKTVASSVTLRLSSEPIDPFMDQVLLWLRCLPVSCCIC